MLLFRSCLNPEIAPLVIDARSVYRKVTRKIYDFFPEQEQNLLAIVWLYRGQRERFLGLVSASERKFRSLIDTSIDWVWEIDAEGRYSYLSPRAVELLGYTPEEIVGKTPFDLMPPDEAQRVWSAFEPIWRARQPFELLARIIQEPKRSFELFGTQAGSSSRKSGASLAGL